jgi:hypothetical protein
MAAIDAIVFAVAAGFAFAVLITVIVIIGVHQEERRLTLTRSTPPGIMARLARIVLGWNVRKDHRDGPGLGNHDDRAEPLEHSGMTIRG